MDTLILIIACLYVLFESYSALESMPSVSVLRFFRELANPYALKYWVCGIYALTLLYHAKALNGWWIVVVIPAVFLVGGRMLYRIQHSKWYLHN